MSVPEQVHETVKHFVDVVAITAIGATVVGYLPAATAIFTFLWVLIRFLETQTMREFIRWVLRRTNAPRN